MKTLEVRKTSLPIFWVLYAALYATLIWGWVSLAHAAEPDVISFQAPTNFKDGSPIPAGTIISYNIYQGVQGQPKTKIATITTTGTTVTTGLVPGTTYCFAATAVIAGVEGDQNADVADDPLTPVKEGNCKLTPPLVPGSFVVTVK